MPIPTTFHFATSCGMRRSRRHERIPRSRISSGYHRTTRTEPIVTIITRSAQTHACAGYSRISRESLTLPVTTSNTRIARAHRWRIRSSERFLKSGVLAQKGRARESSASPPVARPAFCFVACLRRRGFSRLFGYNRQATVHLLWKITQERKYRHQRHHDFDLCPLNENLPGFRCIIAIGLPESPAPGAFGRARGLAKIKTNMQRTSVPQEKANPA
jgi:hypothetical protein